jgi:MoaA/NifB/PqqE/SkfB family radical SAM enzyme
MLDSMTANRPAAAGTRFAAGEYVELTVHFKCNLKCVHCMIEGTMDWLKPESADRFEEILALNSQQGRWKGLILTGSEVTLRNDLPELARMARSSGFEHVRIQTHGMRLASPEYCRELVDAGIDEYFVSVTAADAGTHDAITAVPGAFDKMMRGSRTWTDRRRRHADEHRHSAQLPPVARRRGAPRPPAAPGADASELLAMRD